MMLTPAPPSRRPRQVSMREPLPEAPEETFAQLREQIARVAKQRASFHADANSDDDDDGSPGRSTSKPGMDAHQAAQHAERTQPCRGQARRRRRTRTRQAPSSRRPQRAARSTGSPGRCSGWRGKRRRARRTTGY